MKIPPIVPEDAQACHGPCMQGRLPCPTPEACERPDPNDRRVVSDLFITVVCIAAAAILALSIWKAYA